MSIDATLNFYVLKKENVRLSVCSTIDLFTNMANKLAR